MKDGMRGVTFEAFKVLEKDGWNARMLHLYSHAGTHMDAPLHFGVNDTTIDRIPPERFFADAWVIDAPAVTDSMMIGIEHLKDVKDRLTGGRGPSLPDRLAPVHRRRELPDGAALDRPGAGPVVRREEGQAHRRRAALRGHPDGPGGTAGRPPDLAGWRHRPCRGSLQPGRDPETEGEGHRPAAQDRRRRRRAGRVIAIEE